MKKTQAKNTIQFPHNEIIAVNMKPQFGCLCVALMIKLQQPCILLFILSL